MHMWMWFGYDLGEFLFAGLTITTRWAFALTWIVLFFVALLFEGSKVYLAKVQREALQKLLPYRSDERRTLLCDREAGGVMEPTTSRNTGAGQVGRWASFRIRALLNAHQSLVFLAHNTVGYLLMLAVMLYNVQLLLAVVLGMMLGYFLFGTHLTRLQMQCFSTKRVVICTPECDDTAESSTPPLLGAPAGGEGDAFACRTRTCIRPSHYSPAAPPARATCHYGARRCPARVARAAPGVEDARLLATERCCKEPAKAECCKEATVPVEVHDRSEGSGAAAREDSPQITCCNARAAPSDSQERIVEDL